MIYRIKIAAIALFFPLVIYAQTDAKGKFGGSEAKNGNLFYKLLFKDSTYYYSNDNKNFVENHKNQ